MKQTNTTVTIAALGLLLWTSNSVQAAPRTPPILREICSHQELRLGRLDRNRRTVVPVLNITLSSNQIYRVDLDCGPEPRLHFYTQTYDLHRVTVSTLEQSSLRWDPRREALSIKSILKPNRDHLTLYIRPIADEVSARDCDGCYSERFTENGTIRERWFDSRNQEIPEPKTVQLGKKVLFFKNWMSPVASIGLLSPHPIRREIEDLAVRSLQSPEELSEFPEDEKFLGATPLSNLRDRLYFSASSLLFRGNFDVNNHTVENTATFYRAQIFPYSEVFSALSRVSL